MDSNLYFIFCILKLRVNKPQMKRYVKLVHVHDSMQQYIVVTPRFFIVQNSIL